MLRLSAHHARVLAIFALVTACTGQDAAPSPAAPDAGTIEAEGEADATPCTVSTYYGDRDGDGYGSPDLIAVDCVIPEGFVENDLDCDDTDARNNPDGTEICDGLDNDCDVATVEVCPTNCAPHLRASATGVSTSYMFCNTGLTFAGAEALCENQGMQLVRVDDQAEQDYLAAERTPAFGGPAETWIGASDLVENTWVWADTTQFWSGRANGAIVDGLFARWNGGEPNNGDGIEDCALMIANAAGPWDDRPCNQGRRFICERAAPTP